MKKILTAVATALLLLGCARQEVDLSGINEKLAELDNRITALEGNITSLQSAIGDGVFVQKVEQYADPATGKTVGVTVTYTSGKVVYFEISPKADYAGPVLSVITSGSGDLVWAVDGIPIKVNGKEVPVYQTPVFSIDEEGYLWVSIDGEDPVRLGQVQNEGATLKDGIFTDIQVTGEAVVLTLSDGSTVNIPFAEAFCLVIGKTEYVYAKAEPIEIPYTVSAKTAATVVGVAGYSPKEFSVKVEADKIVVTPLKEGASGILLAYADSKVGLTSLVNLTIEAEGMEVTDKPFNEAVDYMADGTDATVVAHVVSNMEFDVKPMDEWIHLVSVKAQAYVLTFSLDDNTTGALRTGKVNILKKGTETVIQTLTIAQDKAVVGEVTDLGKKGTANSYLLTKAGEYKFKAVKGNSDESVGAIAGAMVVWETENTTTAPETGAIIASVEVKDGYICFSTQKDLKPGNALIAAIDASDNILWSWHIWIPATEVAVWDSEEFCGAKMMDRNLGALVATGGAGEVDPLSIGLYYQWGRKDPFPGAASFEKSPKGAQVAGTAWTYHKELISTEYSIQHPTEYASVPEVDDGVWNTEDPKDLWNTEDGKKTLYDPCPPGYRVPVYNSELPMWKGSDEGFTFDGNRVSYGDFHFTVAGYLDCWGASYAYSNLRTHVWASKWYDEKRATCMYFRLDKDTKYYSQKFHKAKAGSVRCVAE